MRTIIGLKITLECEKLFGCIWFLNIKNGTGVILELRLFDVMKSTEIFSQMIMRGSFVFEKVIHFIKVLMILKTTYRFQKNL